MSAESGSSPLHTAARDIRSASGGMIHNRLPRLGHVSLPRSHRGFDWLDTGRSRPEYVGRNMLINELLTEL